MVHSGRQIGAQNGGKSAATRGKSGFTAHSRCTMAAFGLNVVAFEDGIVTRGRTARVQRIVAAAPGYDLSSTPLDL